MPASYIEKLIVFHDTFVKYVCSHIQRQKIMEHGFEVPSITNSFSDKLQPINKIPLMNIAALALELWNNKGQRTQAANIKSLFPIAESQLIQLLSKGILEVAISFESELDKTDDLHKIGFFASEAATKFLNNFQADGEISAQTVSNVILKQYSWLSSFRGGDIFSTYPPRPSKHYYFVFKSDLLEYINHPKIPFISLSQFLRTKFKLKDEIQIILKGEVEQEIKLQIDISYRGLNGYELETEIFKLDRLAYSVEKLQATQLVKNSSPPPTNSLKSRLKTLYSLQELPRLIDDDSIPTQKMDNYHVKLELIEDSKRSSIETSQMFIPDTQDQVINKILVIAEQGMGKSSFLTNIAYNWGKHNLFADQFTYLFKIDLKLFNSDWVEDYSKEDLKDNIFKCFVDYLVRLEILNVADQLTPEDRITTEEIFNIVNDKYKNEIIFIVDSYEYLVSQTLRVKSLIEQLFKFKYLIVTSMPNAINSVIEEKFDRKIESTGFNGKGTIEYINRFFNNQQQLLDKAVREYYQDSIDQPLLTYFGNKQKESDQKIYLQLKRIHLHKNIDSPQYEESIRSIIKEYYCQARDALLQLIRENLQIRELTNSPLGLTILCLVTSDYNDLARFKENFSTISLYQEFILWIGKRYIIKSQKLSIDSEDISLARVLELEEFKTLQQVAYEGYKANRLALSGHFIDQYTYSKQSISLREIYNFGLLRTEANTKGRALLDKTYLFIHPNLQQFLIAQLLINRLASKSNEISSNTAEFIAQHRNEPKYLMTLQFMVGLVQTQSSLVAIKFWEAIVCNVNGLLELGTEYKATLLMNLLRQAGTNKETSYFIPHREAMVNFIDNSVIKGTEDFLRWGDTIKATGYLSENMLNYILTIIRNNSPQQSQAIEDWEESELESPPCFISQPPASIIRKSFVSILYHLVHKFSHYKLYNNKEVFYTLKPYLSNGHTDWQTIELVFRIFTDLIKINREDFLDVHESQALLVESVSLINGENLKEPAIILIKTIIQTTNDQVIINFAISLIRDKLNDDIVIDVISRIADSYNNLASLTLEMLIFNIKTSNYIDCCTATSAISKLPSVVCDSNHFVRTIVGRLFQILTDDESLNYRIMKTIQQIVLNNVLDITTSTFIKDKVAPISRDPKKPLAYYVANSIISELQQEPKTTVGGIDTLGYTPYHKITFSPLDLISSSSQDNQQTPQIDFIDLSLESLAYFLRNEDSEIRFTAADKLNTILSESATELKTITLNNLKDLILSDPEAENSGVIYTISIISSSNVDVINDGLEILIPLLTSENSRTFYSSIFAIATISQNIKIPQGTVTLILDKLFILLRIEGSPIVYNSIKVIGEIARIAISYDYHLVNPIFDELLNFINPSQDTQIVRMGKLVRHQTYSVTPEFALPYNKPSLHQSPDTSPRAGPSSNSQPIMELSSIGCVSRIPDIEDIIPSINCKSSLYKVAINALLIVVQENNLQANTIILLKLINLADNYKITSELSNVVATIINSMPLKIGVSYFKVPSLQIRQVTIKAITLKLKGELTELKWSEHIRIALNIIGIEIFEYDALENNLHESAKKYLKKIVQNIDAQKLEWINSRFDQLIKLSSHTVYMMKDIFHIILKDEQMTQEISIFLINCITKLSFTMTISKSTAEHKYTISCTESYTFHGEEYLPYLEMITNAAMTQIDPLVEQYQTNIPLFHNTGSAIMLAASDIKDIRSIVSNNKLKVDMWEASILHSTTDKILLLEKRNYFGEYEAYKIKLQDTIVDSIKFIYHPDNIREVIQQIYGGMQYTKSEISIHELSIASGYRILSLVNTSPGTIVNFLENNDLSPFTDSNPSLDSSSQERNEETIHSPKRLNESPNLEESTRSLKRLKGDPDESELTITKRAASPEETYKKESLSTKKTKTTPSKDINALSIHSPKSHVNNPDSDIFMLHRITYDNPPPIYPQIDQIPSLSSKEKTLPNDHHKHYPSSPIYKDNLFFLSFFSKEYIEAAPIIKYFWKEMLYLPSADLPEFMNNNFFWITAHYFSCQIGLFAVTGQIELQSSLLITAPYAIRTITYDYLAKQRQITLLNDGNKTIHGLQDFIEKCGIDMTIQTVLGLTYTTPFLSTSTGGLYCYYSHNQELIDELSNQEMIIPYITSISAGYLTMSIMNFDFYKELGAMLAVEQSLYIIQSMVVVHDTTTLLLLTTQDVRAPVYDYMSNIIGDLYDYYFKNGEDYEQ